MATQILKVRKLSEAARLPVRATPAASGFDLYARIDATVRLTRSPRLVGTGIALEIPPGWDAQVRPRSGLTSKGVAVALGTIDADYRGELFVTMWTFGELESYEIHDGDRVAQLVVAMLAPLEIAEAAELAPSARGGGGHGSTGR